jgi:alpha-galactosidase
MPLMRVGADTKEVWDWAVLRLIGHQGRPSAKVNLSHSLARSLMDRTILLSDPDVFFSRTENLRLEDPQKFLIGIVAWAFASQLMSSDAPPLEGSPASSPGAPGDASPGGGAASGALSQPAFIAELSSLWRKLGDRDFGVERFDLSSPDLYCFRSREGDIHGAINLSSRTEVLALEPPGSPLLGAPRGETKPAVLPPRSIVLFGLGTASD